MVDDPRELLGAYALDALDDAERKAVERLLLDDAGARAELYELQLAASWLVNSALRPRERVRDRIAREVDQDTLGGEPGSP